MRNRRANPDSDKARLRQRTPPDAPEDEAAAEAVFRSLVGGHLASWDERIEPPTPHPVELAQLVSRHREAMRRKLWRELLKVWIAGAFVIGFMLLLLRWSLVGFVVLQGAALLGGVLFLTVTRRREREGDGEWTT